MLCGRGLYRLHLESSGSHLFDGAALLPNRPAASGSGSLELLIALAPILAAAATAVLVGLAAIASSQRGQLKHLRRLTAGRAGFAVPQARALVFLMFFGLLLGIAIALGFLPGNVFVLIGVLGGCAVVRNLLSGTRSSAASWWLIPFGWALVAGTIRHETIDLAAVLGAQAALGPGALVRPAAAAVVTGAACSLGLVSGVFWAQNLPRLDGGKSTETLEAVVRWGECALISAAALSFGGGLLVGGLVHGPLDTSALSRIGIAFAAVGAGTVIVSATRRATTSSSPGRIIWLMGSLSLATLVAAVISK